MARNKRRGDGLVYSTETGRVCGGCGWPADACRCSRESAEVPAGPARVQLETKGRKGRGVTLVREIPLPLDEVAELGKALKKKCGSGGTIKEGIVEIQGDHRDTVIAELERRGIPVRRVGG